ncbi:putative Short-chain dehydrogenase [Seiridium cardinale]
MPESTFSLARPSRPTKPSSTPRRPYHLPRETLTFLHLDLADLSSIKVTVDRFLARERSLHVLFNNAGVLSSEKKLTTTPQGYEQHIGINVMGGFLLTQLLTPLLVATAKTERPNTVRVIWTGSSASEMFAQKNIGATADMMQKETLTKKPGNERYWASKVGNWSHGVEYALRHKDHGVTGVPVNPGNLQFDLYRDAGLGMRLFLKLITYPPVNGAYTELYASFSPDITIEKNGS